eukprot:6184337-Pleurochrysis_carterae.AAC.1
MKKAPYMMDGPQRPSSLKQNTVRRAIRDTSSMRRTAIWIGQMRDGADHVPILQQTCVLNIMRIVGCIKRSQARRISMKERRHEHLT